MKKITFILLLFVIPFMANAQSVEYSFEASEGYTLGNLHEQNNWSVMEPIISQVTIVDDKSTDGNNSLFIEGLNSPFGDAQGNLVLVGAFSELLEIEDDVVTLEFDIYLTDTTDDENDPSDFAFQLQSTEEGFITSRIVFNWQDDIRIVETGDSGPAFSTIGTFEREEWISVKIVHDFDADEIEYYINGVLIHTGDVWSAESVDQIVILFDNFDSSAYIDNIKINAEEADCDHDQLWLVGAGVTQAGWGWDTPVALPCTGNNVYSGVVEFTPQPESDGNFRFFTEEGNWGSGLNFTYFEDEDFIIDDLFEDAEDDDNNFLFVGDQGEYVLTVDFENKEITMTPANFSNVDFTQINFDFFVNYNGLNLSASEIINSVEVFSLSGKRVSLDKVNSTNGVISISNLAKGVYIAKAQIGNTVKTFKFAK